MIALRSVFACWVCLFVLFQAFPLPAQITAQSPAPARGISFSPAGLEAVALSDFGLLEGYDVEVGSEGLSLIVKERSPAARAGMQTGDLLLTINNIPTHSLREARAALRGVTRDTTASFRFRRGQVEQVTFLHADWQAYRSEIAIVYALDYAKCFGLEVENYQLSENGGVLVRQVASESNATTAGLQAGDVITAANGEMITVWSELYNLLLYAPKNQPVALSILREGKSVETQLENTPCQGQFTREFPLEPGALGITQRLDWVPGTTSPTGITIGAINLNSIAEQAGLQSGDRLIAIDRHPIGSATDLLHCLNTGKSQTGSVACSIVRAGQPREITLTLPTVRTSLPTAPPSWKDEETLQPQVFRAFPNPTSGLFTLDFSAQPTPMRVQVFDLNGALLYSELVNEFSGEYSRQLDFRGTGPGTLAIRIEQDGLVFSRLVIIQ